MHLFFLRITFYKESSIADCDNLENIYFYLQNDNVLKKPSHRFLFYIWIVLQIYIIMKPVVNNYSSDSEPAQDNFRLLS